MPVPDGGDGLGTAGTDGFQPGESRDQGHGADFRRAAAGVSVLGVTVLDVAVLGAVVLDVMVLDAAALAPVR
ncbi:hypothetical protein GCM10023083_04770 [Streptomyces phyllanthi]